MIRACRFTALGEGWHIEEKALQYINDFANTVGIQKVSKERIRDEILKALSYPKPSNFFRALHATGLLPIIFPDLEKGVGVDQNEYHSTAVYRCKSCKGTFNLLELNKLKAENTAHC